MLTIVFLLVGCSGVIFYPYGPEWSPDGSKIVFIKNYDIWVMNTDGSNQTKLTQGFGGDFLAWSPDGTKIAFGSQQKGDNYNICVMNVDGSNKIKLTGN